MKVFWLCAIVAFLSSCGTQAPCQGEDNCLTNPNCRCWCSQICDYRGKKKDDSPHYIENDPNGKFCYCKQWDFDHYKENCIDDDGVKEPLGAE